MSRLVFKHGKFRHFIMIMLILAFCISLYAITDSKQIPTAVYRPYHEHGKQVAVKKDLMASSNRPDFSWTAYTNPYNYQSFFEDDTYQWFASPFGVIRYNPQLLYSELLTTANSGLNSNFITDMARDTSGNYWFSHLAFAFDSQLCGGISVLHSDGTWSTMNYTDSPFHSNNITCLEFDSSGKLWIGYAMNGFSDGGLSCYNPADQSWQYYTKTNSSLPSNTVMSMTRANDGSLWIAFSGDVDPDPYVGGGLLHITANGWDVFNTQIADDPNEPLKDWYIKNVVEDSQGNIWFCLSGSVDNGLFKYNGTTFTKYTTDLTNMYWDVAIGNQDELYINTITGGILKFQNDTWAALADPDGYLTDIMLQNLFMDCTNTMWIALYDDTMICYRNNQFILPDIFPDTPVKGLNSIWDIKSDNNGKTWFGTGWYVWGDIPLQTSLMGFDDNNWEYYNYNDYQNYVVNDVSFDRQGAVLIATGDANSNAADLFDMYGGICRKTDTAWQIYDTETSGYPFIYASNAQEDFNGHLWAGTRTDGIAVYDNIAWTQYNMTTVTGLYSNTITDVLAQHDAPIVWVSTVVGVYKVDISNSASYQWQYFNPTNSGLPGWETSSLVRDAAGRIWASTDNGIASYFGSTWNSVADLEGIIVTDLTVDENDCLWLATLDQGLIYYDGMNYAVYNRSNTPLPTSHITQVESDRNGKLWMNPFNNGIYCLDYSSTSVENDPLPSFSVKVDNYPNPFYANTNISYDLPKTETVEIVIYNTKGQVVKKYPAIASKAGMNYLIWDGKNDKGASCSTGIYFMKIKGSNYNLTHKMTLIK
ncbi:MAG: two-component regulator propeller domain-containing protein [Candidatus Cloacimonadaceae bacterium]